MHGLLHLADDSEYFSCPLDDVSAFSFENKLQDIKQCIRKPYKVVEQVLRRNAEGKLLKNSQKLSKLNTLSCMEGNNCFLLSDKNLCFVKRIFDQYCLVEIVNKEDLQSYFQVPCDSTIFDIYCAKISFCSHVSKVLISAFICKMACIPVEQDLVFMPLVHGNF